MYHTNYFLYTTSFSVCFSSLSYVILIITNVVWSDANAIQKPSMHASYLISCYCSNIVIFRSTFYSFLLHVYNLYFVIKKKHVSANKSLLQTDYSFDILILTCVLMTNLDYCIKGYLWVYWINSLIGKYQPDRK